MKTTTVKSGWVAKANAITGLLGGCKDLFDMAASAYQVSEVEATRRAEICAERDATLARLRAQTEMFQTYLDASFRQRGAVLDGLFSRLDRAMDRGDIAAVELILHAVVDTLRTSPLGDMSTADGVRELLSDRTRPLEL